MLHIAEGNIGANLCAIAQWRQRALHLSHVARVLLGLGHEEGRTPVRPVHEGDGGGTGRLEAALLGDRTACEEDRLLASFRWRPLREVETVRHDECAVPRIVRMLQEAGLAVLDDRRRRMQDRQEEDRPQMLVDDDDVRAELLDLAADGANPGERALAGRKGSDIHIRQVVGLLRADHPRLGAVAAVQQQFIGAQVDRRGVPGREMHVPRQNQNNLHATTEQRPGPVSYATSGLA